MTNYVNETIGAQCTLKQDGTTAVNADSVVCVVTAPSGSETTYTYGVSSQMSTLGTGIYACQVTATAAGSWVFEFTAVKDGKPYVEKQTVGVRSL